MIIIRAHYQVLPSIPYDYYPANFKLSSTVNLKPIFSILYFTLNLHISYINYIV